MTKDYSGFREKKSNKVAVIFEILKTMEKRGVSKDFIFKEIKKFRVQGIKKSMTNVEILSKAPPKFISHLYNLLNSRSSIPQTVLPPTKNLHWFYTDVVASSNPKIAVKEQIHKILVLNELISRTETFRKHDPKSLAILPSGDGYAIGFSDTLESPLQLAIELHQLLNEYNKSQKNRDRVYIRSGIESGLVYFMRDLNGNYTTWGPGIIMARRVMDLGEKMHILTSEKIANQLGRLSPEIKSILHDIGNYPVKWEGQLAVSNIYSEEDKFGNKNLPQKPIESPALNFKFERVELILDVKNSKTMMTHHTMIWDLENVSNEPKDMIHYDIFGDSPKKFSDLNISVKDSRGKNLKILSIDAKNPLHKKFKVQLDKPIIPGNKKMLKVEWDWEEPDRIYNHKFSSECKKFRFVLYISKEVELDQKVLKNLPDQGQAVYASPPPLVKFRDGKTVIVWEKKNIMAHDEYILKW